jgi:ammonia channel protein AmtB
MERESEGLAVNTELGALTTLFTEFYYFICIILMFLIHVGFCLYEVGVSREKNKMRTLMKNAMLIPLVTVTFFFFGWWIYFALPDFPFGKLRDARWAYPWSEVMGAHLGGKLADPTLALPATPAIWTRTNGVFWGCFVMFSCTTGSILSGAVIERIRSWVLWVFTVLVGSVTWLVAAAWGWSADGWMVRLLGYHDSYAAGVVHALAGGSCLGMLLPLGARIGRYKADGTARTFPPNNAWLVIIGLFLIYTGFWGFYASCNVPVWDIDKSPDRTFFSATTIYYTPTTLSAVTFNFLMALAGGLLAGYAASKGDAYWTFSGGLAGVIATSPGNDLYHPLQAFLIAAFGVLCLYKFHAWLERKLKVDDAVGAVAVHGIGGVYGVVVSGFVLWGYPSSPNAEFARVTPWGQTAGAVICFFALGFLPCWLLALLFKKLGVLRIPPEIEIAGLDHGERTAAREQSRELVEAEIEAARRLPRP